MYAHVMPVMSPKRPKNLSISERLLKIAEAYCQSSDRKFTSYVEELMRADLREKGLPVDAPASEVMRFVEDQKRAQRKKRAR